MRDGKAGPLDSGDRRSSIAFCQLQEWEGGETSSPLFDPKARGAKTFSPWESIVPREGHFDPRKQHFLLEYFAATQSGSYPRSQVDPENPPAAMWALAVAAGGLAQGVKLTLQAAP